jgi:hypothetical protein
MAQDTTWNVLLVASNVNSTTVGVKLLGFLNYMYMDANLILHLWEPNLGILNHIFMLLQREGMAQGSPYS